MRYNRTAVVLLLVASLSHAQDAAPSEREMIQQLVQQVKALQEKVTVLESQQRASDPANADATPLPVSPPAPQAADNPAQPYKNFMNSTAFSGEDSEKLTTRS